MKQTVLFLCLVTFAIGAACRAASPGDFTDTPSETRLHLHDRTQDLRTTSVNWPDLVKSPRGQTPTPRPKRPLRILLDAGHGGRDFGAQGLSRIVEKDLTLRVSDLVKRSLERYQRLNDTPIEVRMSRTDDSFVGLRERVRLANEWPADLFVSIHANSSDYARARGFEVYFINQEDTDGRAMRIASSDDQHGIPPSVLSILDDAEKTVHVNESSNFAETLFQAMSLSVRPHRRGVHQAPFTVLHGTQMPAVLIEVGYLTNKDDAAKLTKAPYLKRLSGAISAGIIEFAAHLHKVI